MHDRSDRTRSLSADSTRNESDKFNMYYEQDFRRKIRPQTNSVQQIGGNYLLTIFFMNFAIKVKKIFVFS